MDLGASCYNDIFVNIIFSDYLNSNVLKLEYCDKLIILKPIYSFINYNRIKNI